MFARSFVACCLLASIPSKADQRASFGPPGYELPDRVTPQNLFSLSEKIRNERCNSTECKTLVLAIAEILTNANGRKSGGTIWNGQPHKDIPYGAIKAAEIDESLRKYKNRWPELCRAVVEIGVRDDFEHGIENYAWIASAVLDVARHLTHTGLDCLGQALAAMPQSRYLQASMHSAWVYCLDEGRGAARCARLKPTDPEFLPVDSFRTQRQAPP